MLYQIDAQTTTDVTVNYYFKTIAVVYKLASLVHRYLTNRCLNNSTTRYGIDSNRSLVIQINAIVNYS